MGISLECVRLKQPHQGFNIGEWYCRLNLNSCFGLEILSVVLYGSRWENFPFLTLVFVPEMNCYGINQTGQFQNYRLFPLHPQGTGLEKKSLVLPPVVFSVLINYLLQEVKKLHLGSKQRGHLAWSSGCLSPLTVCPGGCL